MTTAAFQNHPLDMPGLLGRRLALLVCALPVLLASCTASRSTAAGAAATSPARPAGTTLILVRHAERDFGFDPPLNEAGRARAQALADALDESGITAIYAPALIRTTQTAEPLARRLGLPIEPIAVVRLVAPFWLARELVDEIRRRHPGEVVLYVGNDSNLDAIYRHLGGSGRPPVRHEDLYTVILSDEGDARFIKATYGETD